MLTIKEKHFSSWHTFKAGIVRSLFPREPFRKGRFLFRGQSQASWNLSSTFDRTFPSLSGRDRREHASLMFRKFKEDSKRLELPELARINDDVLLALGQHYGLPTRLLDWTDSYLIASFFAFRERILGAAGGDVAIWALDTEVPVWADEIHGVNIVSVESAGNVRLRNQAGKFTLSRTEHACLEDYVLSLKGRGSPLRKYTVPAAQAREALADLDGVGVNASFIFPEVDGSAQLAFMRTIIELGL